MKMNRVKRVLRMLKGFHEDEGGAQQALMSIILLLAGALVVVGLSVVGMILYKKLKTFSESNVPQPGKVKEFN